MDHDPGAVVSAAAMQTMRGTAQVTVSFGMSVPDFETTAEYAGVVDFDADLCRLTGQPDGTAAAMAFEGPIAYMRLRGRTLDLDKGHSRHAQHVRSAVGP